LAGDYSIAIEPIPAQPPDPYDRDMVFVRGGCFRMGDTFGDGRVHERPAHKVCVEDFTIGRYEVTQAQWRELMNETPSVSSSCGDDCPVENVSWKDVQEFLIRLNRRVNSDYRNFYRLPTEAEWEYAARSRGKRERYAGVSGHADPEAVAWYGEDSEMKPHPVGIKGPNGLGLYDMSGNVAEWVRDWYERGYYTRAVLDNPTGPRIGQDRLYRGGSWGSPAHDVRTSSRSWMNPDDRNGMLGFRLAR
jgi:formylglycine-generating enzyme required for sulfatase activity